MLFCHLCLLISCDSLVFWILSFDYSLCLFAWYLYFLLFYILLTDLLYLRNAPLTMYTIPPVAIILKTPRNAVITSK